jgi:hypothetical protein
MFVTLSQFQNPDLSRAKMISTTVVVGMKLEAWIVRQPGIRVICGFNGSMLARISWSFVWCPVVKWG